MASSRTQSAILKSPSASRIADSQCYPQYTASLKCLEESNSDKSKCHEQFDIYKECKKKELYTFPQRLSVVLPHHREARLERNRNRSLFS